MDPTNQMNLYDYVYHVEIKLVLNKQYNFNEQQITKIHNEFIRFCQERGYTIPKLNEVKAICDHPHTSAPWH